MTALLPAVEPDQLRLAPLLVIEEANSVPGIDGAVLAEAVSEVLLEVMNCATFDAAELSPCVSTAVTK